MNKKMGKELALALKNTIPVLTGYLFLGFTYGVYMKVNGFNFIYTAFVCLSVFSGAAQFVLVPILLAPFDPLNTIVIMLLLGARHIFYSIAMLNKYNQAGKYKFFLIFGLSDETFSLNYSSELPYAIKRNKYYFLVTILDQSYWLIGSVTGAVCGNFITFNTLGLDFVMTAMFVVIFVNQFMNEKNHFSSVLGIVASLISLIFCLLVFKNSQYFIVISMALILIVLTIFKDRLSRKKEEVNYQKVNTDILMKGNG